MRTITRLQPIEAQVIPRKDAHIISLDLFETMLFAQ